MSRIIVAIVLAGTLAGCVTSEGPYSRSALTSVAPQRPAPVATNRPTKATQTAHAPRRQKVQVAMQQRALGPLMHRAENPLILGAAF